MLTTKRDRKEYKMYNINIKVSKKLFKTDANCCNPISILRVNNIFEYGVFKNPILLSFKDNLPT